MAATSMFRTPEGEARYFSAYDRTLALWPVPVESFDLPTRFGSTHIHACGPEGAAPLLLIPGQAISSTMWCPNVEGLSRGYRVYTLDILGDMGKSVQSRKFQQPTEFADWMSDILDGLHLEWAYVAGLSYGGFIGLRLALSFPERVKKLVLMAPASLLPIRRRFFLRMGVVLLPFVPFETKQRSILGTTPPAAAPAIKQMLTTTDFQYSMYLPPVYTDDELRQLKTPTLLLIGDHEVIYDYKAALKRATTLMPDVKTAIIPGAGHALNFDQPELVNAHILEFLA